MVIYICSPYSGDIERNTINTRKICQSVVAKGHIPIAPHLLFPQFMDKALEMNKELINRCDEMWIYGDELTEGMTLEILHAFSKAKIPIHFKSLSE